MLWRAEDALLFAGDTMEDTVTYVTEPDELATHVAELERLRELGPRRILPNHGDPDVIAAGGYGPGLIDATQEYIGVLIRLRDEPELERTPLRELVAGPLAERRDHVVRPVRGGPPRERRHRPGPPRAVLSRSRPSGTRFRILRMADSAPREDPDDGLRMGRRRFLGAGAAIAGAALLPSAPAAAAADAATATDAPPASGQIPQLPYRATYPNLPAIPFDGPGTIDTLGRLQIRAQQVNQAKQGLSQKFTIDGVTRRAYAFLYGGRAALGELRAREQARGGAAPQPRPSLGHPPPALRRPGRRSTASSRRGLLARPAGAVLDVVDELHGRLRVRAAKPARVEVLAETDPNSASRQFWPMIAEHGFGYNLIVPERVTGAPEPASCDTPSAPPGTAPSARP